MSVILVTHDLGVVAGHTDEIMVMYGGRVVEKAPTKVLFANMKMPYTEALLKSIPRIEDPSHSRLNVIPGRPPDLVHPPKGCRFAPRCSFVQDRCLQEAPPLITAEHPEHQYACWYPVGSPHHRARTAELAAAGQLVGGAPADARAVTRDHDHLARQQAGREYRAVTHGFS